MAEPKKIAEKGEEAAPEGAGKETEAVEGNRPQAVAKPTPEEALYAQFVANNMILTVEDIAAYKAKEGAMIVVLTDPIGRSLVNVSFNIRPDILQKLNDAAKKA